MKPRPPCRLQCTLVQVDDDSRRYTYENGVLDVEASKSKINEDIKVLINKQNKRIADWTAEQKSVFDDLAMAVSTGSFWITRRSPQIHTRSCYLYI